MTNTSPVLHLTGTLVVPPIINSGGPAELDWQTITSSDQNVCLTKPGQIIRITEDPGVDKDRILYYLIPDENGNSIAGWQSKYFTKNDLLLVLPGACERSGAKAHQIQLPVLMDEKRVVLWIDNRDLILRHRGGALLEPISLSSMFAKLSL